jgi:L-tartrate/succinate antiporter
VIAALVTESLPNLAIGVVGCHSWQSCRAARCSRRQTLTSPGSMPPARPSTGHFPGFASTTVWLVAAVFMFALGYQKTGLGRRIALLLVRALGRNTLLVGYATTLADTVLAPFTPSNTARSAGIIFPIMSNLPSLYDFRLYDASARQFGGYIMWTTFAAGCVTSSLFMTACAPNFLAIGFIATIVHVHISYLQWMKASLPLALPLLVALPLLAYVLCPPEIKRSPQVTVWAGSELRGIILAVLAVCSIVLWLAGGSFIDPTLTTLVAVALMLVYGVVSWDDTGKN